MLNFTFHNPTRIHFGEGQIAAISKELPVDAKVLVTYGGGSIKSNGVYEQVSAALANHEWVEFAGIEPNPSYDTLMMALSVIDEYNIDYLLAVGGGSVVDGTKFIAAAAVFGGEDPWDILAKRAPIEQALPMGAVLTLPATGSESNGGAVVTRDGSKLSFGSPLVRPLFAVLDPAVSLSLSDRQISNGVVDAFAHIMEQYLTYSVDAKVQDRFAEGLLLTLIEEGPKALVAPGKTDLAVRGNIMWSATMALNGLIGAGVPHDWATHMIGHELTAAHGVDHARSLSIILPAVMKVCRADKHAKLLQYAERVWGITEGDDNEKIVLAISKTEQFFQQMQVPVRLTEVGISVDDIDNLLTKLEQHGMVALGENQKIDLAMSREILMTAL